MKAIKSPAQGLFTVRGTTTLKESGCLPTGKSAKVQRLGNVEGGVTIYIYPSKTKVCIDG